MAISHTAYVTLNEPCDQIDLDAWLFGLSDSDYQACAKGHRGAGVYCDERARHDQHRVDRGPPDRAALPLRPVRSLHGRDGLARKPGVPLPPFPVAAGVQWTLDVKPKTTGGSEFACTVQVELPAALGVLARLSLLGHFLGRHVNEEARGFAADIARKHITRSSSRHGRELIDSTERGGSNDVPRHRQEANPAGLRPGQQPSLG